ncbi:hypothetical protein B0H14DRAFT_2605428 [Mycena olivaceomarginata]|nr:hypothetical protein B0H14DRAFT_2605428 [Mycena olivaceomarginata]
MDLDPPLLGLGDVVNTSHAAALNISVSGDHNLRFKSIFGSHPFAHLLAYSESTTDLFIELQYTEKYFPEPCDASSNDEHDLELIYGSYSTPKINELSSHLPFVHPISDFEPVPITEMIIELILKQETTQGVDFEAIASAAQHDPSVCAHENFDEDLCTICELYTEQPEYLSPTEPSKRAKSQPFFWRTSCAQDFVPELLDTRTESHAPIGPTDVPPSYQEAILISEPSFAYARPRIRAELSINPPSASVFHRDAIAQNKSILKLGPHGANLPADHDYTRRYHSNYTKIFIQAEPRPPDKPSNFILPLTTSIPSLVTDFGCFRGIPRAKSKVPPSVEVPIGTLVAYMDQGVAREVLVEH